MNTKRACALSFGLILIAGFGMVSGQATPIGIPPASPAVAAPVAPAPAAPAPRHVAQVPQGLQAVKVGEHVVFCEATEADWVKQAVANVKPATRPTTMPADMLKILQQRGPDITRQILTDFAATDSKPIADMFAKSADQLKKIDTARPPFIYMPITRKKLYDIVHAGWSDPRYRYVPVTDDIQYSTQIRLDVNGPMDDQVIWVEIGADQKADSKRDQLTAIVADFENKFTMQQAQSGMTEVNVGIGNFLKNVYMDPLKLPPTVQWFGRAVAGVYSLKYTADILGVQRELLNRALQMDDPQNPIVARSVDLLHPLDTNVLRPEVVPFYQDASTLKGSRVVTFWISKGTDAVVSKTLPSLRAMPVADVPDLMKRIKDATAIDLTDQLASGK